MATIFLSHSSRNDALASMLAAWLVQNGFDDLFIDHDDIRSGDKWTEALRRAKSACRVVLCLITPEWLESDECYGEFMAAWYAGRRMVPLLALGAAELNEKQKKRLGRIQLEDQGTDIAKAGAPASLDLDAHGEIAEPLKAGLRAAGALARVGLDPFAFEADREAQAEPFPGLESFGDSDADAAIFFGRSPEIARSLEDLREIRATGDRRAYVILGASGSGKSSLMKAGVLPRLRREHGWFVLRVFRPGTDPLFNLADAIARSGAALNLKLAPGSIRDQLMAAWRAKADLRETLAGIVASLKTAANRERATALIALDQGEELVSAAGDSADALCAYLRAAMGEVADGEPAPFALVLTIRSDSFREFETLKNLEGLETRVQNIRALPTHRLNASIEQPAARYGAEIEPQLIDALMDDAEGQDALPLLAFTLQRLWRQYQSEGVIRKAHYEAIGKLSGLIEDAAERALRGVDPKAADSARTARISEAQDQAAAHAFIPALAQLNERGAAVRRVAKFADFDDEAKALLERFVEWRLLVRSGETIEVAHEAMFREWSRFREWLTGEKARLEALSGLESAAAAWATKGRLPEDLIHRGKRLAEARALTRFPDYKAQLERNPEALAYLERCTAVQKKRNLTIGGGAFAIALLATLAVSIPAIIRYFERAALTREHHKAVVAAENYRPHSPILADDKAAAALKPGAVFRDCPDCPEMTVIPAGSFVMGSPASETSRGNDEGPQHKVTLTKFALGRFDVTFDEWADCVKAGGCTGNKNPNDHGAGRGRRPVIDISWQDAQEFVRWLAARTGRPYRLPSEAEWEYAARAGTTTPYYTGKTIDHMQANFDIFIGKTEPVGSYPPNQFGLYDMAGNAWQWVEDCYNNTYRGAPDNGTAWTTGDCGRRLIRGSSWYNPASQIRSAQRDDYRPGERLAHAGFRVARDLPNP
ncbi:MAG: SUMF1/EgtB/PvdO family nonheme iron enzyme [Pseudomonadota bacterium]|nr:SUMF1/EgtB/PvdO family nonheme iron enzyme [Pseudomonadota bacterium]